MKKLILILSFLMGLSVSWATPVERSGFSWEPLRSLAIQNRGRVKPYDTFARESLVFISGKNKWKGLNPTEVTFGWLFAFDKEWEDEEFIRVDYKPLKEALGLELGRQYFKPSEIRSLESLDKI